MPIVKQLLFLEKTFLEKYAESPGGVELFNFALLRDLSAAGMAVVVPTHSSWQNLLRENAPNIECLATPHAAGDMLGALAALWRLRQRKFDLLLLGNVGNRLIPALEFIRLWNIAPRTVLIAHREPTNFFVRRLRLMPTLVLAVNRQIAMPFKETGLPISKLNYGIINAHMFYPPEIALADENIVKFCVVGHLERTWKGAGIAINAFQKLPTALKAKCQLHLIGYRTPPRFPDASIHAYTWLPQAELAALLRQMTIMLVPSQDENGVMRETFSQAAVQGMLTGLPLIVSALPVLMEKIDEGGGLVFHTTAELTAAMTQLALDAAERRRLGAQCRAVALRRYVWNTHNFLAEISQFAAENG